MKTRVEGDSTFFHRCCVVVEAGDILMLTTPEHDGRTCVYVRVVDGKLEFEGGADLVASTAAWYGPQANASDKVSP